MRKLVLKIALFIPIMAAIIIVNLHIDSAHIFDSERYIDQLSDILVKGYNIANISNFDERLLQKKYIEKVTKCPNIVVLGSSRVLLINEHLFPESIFFNSAVSGAVLSDFLAIYRLYEKKNCDIKTIILGIDPWVFDANRHDSRWQTLEMEYKECLSRVALPSDTLTREKQNLPIAKLKEIVRMSRKKQSLSMAKIKELVSFEYFKVSLNNWNNNFFMTKEEKLDMPLKYSDGSILEYAYSKRDQYRVDELAKEYSYEDYINFKQIDAHSVKLLDDFLAYLKKKDVNVVIFISPYHPITWNNIISKYHIYEDFQSTLTKLERKYDIPQIGSLNPFDFNLTNTDFYDGMHLRPEAVIRIYSSAK